MNQGANANGASENAQGLDALLRDDDEEDGYASDELCDDIDEKEMPAEQKAQRQNMIVEELLQFENQE